MIYWSFQSFLKQSCQTFAVSSFVNFGIGAFLVIYFDSKWRSNNFSIESKKTVNGCAELFNIVGFVPGKSIAKTPTCLHCK